MKTAPLTVTFTPDEVKALIAREIFANGQFAGWKVKSVEINYDSSYTDYSDDRLSHVGKGFTGATVMLEAPDSLVK